MDTSLFWAKTNPRKSLLHHSIDVGMMCRALLSIGTPSSVVSLLPHDGQGSSLIGVAILICALHDIGKAHPFFQAKTSDDSFVQELCARNLLSFREESLIRGYRHECGGRFILERIMKKGCPAVSTDMRKYLGFVIRLHHQRRRVSTKEECALPSYYRDYWEAEQDALFARICAVFREDLSDVALPEHTDAGMTMLLALETLSDWLASGQDAFMRISEELNDEEYAAASQRAATEALHACGLFRLPMQAPGTFDKAFAYIPITRAQMRPLQTTCEAIAARWRKQNRAPALVIIEAPMGEGKTEAALYLEAHLARFFNKSGFYIALPTGATSNAMYARAEAFLGGAQARLVHSQSWLIEQEHMRPGADEFATEASAWLAPTRRALLAQYAVGTVDQAMMSVLQVKYGVLRLLGLSAKVLIVDEIHAYDAYMLRVIEELLRWCSALNIPVILLSATLPYARRKRLIDAYTAGAPNTSSPMDGRYPLITEAYRDGGLVFDAPDGTAMRAAVKVRRVPAPKTWDEAVKDALSRVRGGGCLCILLNTVGEAQEVYRALEAAASDMSGAPWIGLFHARFPMEQRQRIEKECVALFGKDGKRPERAILVSTQVCEQSLDLDFDDMITFLCPIDLLLQRIGRLQRHARRRPEAFAEPNVTVWMPDMNALCATPSAHVYHPWILRVSAQELEKREVIRLPEDIRPLVEAVYGAVPSAGDAAFEEWAKLAFGDQACSEAARGVLLPPPDPKHFSLVGSTNGFMDEEPEWIDPFAETNQRDVQARSIARTRMGMDGVRVALVSKALFDAAKTCPDRETAQAVLKRSVSLSSFWFNNGAPKEGESVIKGEGLLLGIWLILQEDETIGYVYERKGMRMTLRYDQELGAVREEAGP